MTLEAKATLLWFFGAALGVLVLLARFQKPSAENAARPFPTVVAVSLASVATSLLAVGVVSGTLSTHLVQIAPLLMVLALLMGMPNAGQPAAQAVLSFWLTTMAGIWLFLLGLSRFLTGTFSTAEVLLTVVIGMACAAGLAANARAGRLSVIKKVSIIAVAAGLQSLALWLSYQPIIIGR